MPYGRKTTYRRRRGTSYRGSSRYKKKYAPSSKRRNRYTNFAKTKTLRAKWINPMAQSQLALLTYADTGFSRTLQIANGYFQYYVFRGNSPYDPDYTGVGAQPYGFDELCKSTMFTNFNARSSSIRVYFRPEELFANIRRLHCFVFPLRVASITTTDPSDVRMIPNCKETTYDGSCESTRGAKMKHYSSVKRVITETSASENAYSGSYAGNPATSWYWYVLFYTDAVDDDLDVTVYFDIKIKYYTQFSRGITPDES